MKSVLLVLSLLSPLVIVADAIAGCPVKCVCRLVSQNSQNVNGIKVKCGGNPQAKLTSIKEIGIDSIRSDIVNLDLSKNLISTIEPNDFVNFTSLKKLDLSDNSLRKIDASSFGEMLALEKLKLSYNLIVHIFQGAFDKLPMLKQLNISGNALACDCDLLWLIPWSAANKVKLMPAPQCETPSPFNGQLLKKLKIGTDLHCESPLQPLLELNPDQDQLVFEGDAFTLRCRAPRVAVGDTHESEDVPTRAHVFWGWSEKILEPNSTEDIVYHDPKKIFPSIEIIDARHLTDSGLLDSILRIPYSTRNHSGTWDCRLRSQQANLSRSIAVTIISESTKYCSAQITSDNKGKYSWPKTMRGKTVRLTCAREGAPNLYAMNHCSNLGEWTDLDTSSCPYIRETTRILEQFSKVNLSIARGSVLESAKRLRNYTNLDLNGHRFNDPMDVVYIAKTVTNYLDFVVQEKDLGSMLLDIVSQVMRFSIQLLQAAQYIDSSCTKLIVAAEQASLMLAAYTPEAQTQKNNLAIEIFKIRMDSFSGLTCTWFKSDNAADGEKRTFQCSTANNGEGIGIHERHIDAIIQIPSNLITPINSQSLSTQQLQVSVFEDSNLFPQNRNQSTLEVTSCVIGAKLLSKPISNVSESIFIMLRAAPFHHKHSTPHLVWWDPELNNGVGGWSPQGCRFAQLHQGLWVFSCYRLGYYGLQQNTKYLNDFPDELAGARFRYSPPAFYIGGIVLFTCTWINIVTYIAYGNSIQMARRTKHSLINTWLAMALLCFVFTIGIFQTEDYRTCQSIGVSIHYFSLCVILWICVCVSNMYKRLSRHDRNISLPSEDLPKNISQKPILGLYLVGWGIALIICGISGSVNIREYASYSYCFLKSGPALSAVFVPAVILIAFLVILFVCIKCSISTPEDIGHMSEGTQATENVDLDMLEPNLHRNGDRYRSISLSTPTTSSAEDLEHTNGAQLKAHVIVLFLYLVAWLFASISVATPFSDRILYEEELFSIIYAIAASFLGLFNLFFYCIARSDVRMQWSMLSCRNFSKKQCCRSRSVSDSKEHNNIPPVIYHQATATLHSISRSNSQSSKNRAPSNSNILKGAVDLNLHTLNRNESPSGHHHKMNGNVNLVLLHRQQFLHNSMSQSGSESADVFYNPNQINVARKFFKKQKRLQKRNNFEIHNRYRDNNDCLSEVSSMVSFPRRPQPSGLSIFSSGASKVNNTNIHVDKKNLIDNLFHKESRQQNLNPNILSDSCNESDMIVDTERFVLGAEGLRALTSNRTKVNNTPPMVANIYTNVPETLQPQHEIVTMRADDKYKKFINEEDESSVNEVPIDKEFENVSSQTKPEPPHYVNEEFQKQNHSEQNSPVKSCLEFVSNAMVLSLNSPIQAMNTIGLPITSPTDQMPLENEIDKNLNDDGDDDDLGLSKNDEYISSPLEITCVLPHTLQIRSKSLNDLSKGIESICPLYEQQARSISCTQLTRNPHYVHEYNLSDNLPRHPDNSTRILSSPILFSPSLCDINDIPSPSLHHQKTFQQRTIQLESTPVGSESNLFFSPEKIFNPIRRNFASSPTSESDINYQNSEISIRSHELYAPQQDDVLNITLIGEETHFPYQSSEVSDMDDQDDIDDDDYNNCSNDCLLGPRDRCHEDNEDENDEIEDVLNESQSSISIDELYQQITRRPMNEVRSLSEAASSPLLAHHDDDKKELIVENDGSQCGVVSFTNLSAADAEDEYTEPLELSAIINYE
ncbi:Adhesion G protein-coupled receptor A3 [Pseudolycoriella hygida]|uniref:Adhesion G protein-coupled receptor A3 n=1 Tax=Pseudolycoriella hygida TaxID=35572 RepID=A0A9Q0MSB9_9DIPT|nr:Adhesion G protein-coupled receptor A3 [Pseudolycoriella hygida]